MLHTLVGLRLQWDKPWKCPLESPQARLLSIYHKGLVLYF